MYVNSMIDILVIFAPYFFLDYLPSPGFSLVLKNVFLMYRVHACLRLTEAEAKNWSEKTLFCLRPVSGEGLQGGDVNTWF